MEAKVEVKMTPKIMYDFMMYHTYRSFSGIFGIILGIAAKQICLTASYTVCSVCGLSFIFRSAFIQNQKGR